MINIMIIINIIILFLFTIIYYFIRLFKAFMLQVLAVLYVFVNTFIVFVRHTGGFTALQLITSIIFLILFLICFLLRGVDNIYILLQKGSKLLLLFSVILIRCY